MRPLSGSFGTIALPFVTLKHVLHGADFHVGVFVSSTFTLRLAKFHPQMVAQLSSGIPHAAWPTMRCVHFLLELDIAYTGPCCSSSTNGLIVFSFACRKSCVTMRRGGCGFGLQCPSALPALSALCPVPVLL